MADGYAQAIDQPMDMSGEVALVRSADFPRDRPYWAWQLYEARVPLWENKS